MKKNQEFDVLCTDLTRMGYGLCHAEGMPVFVPDLLPQETARIKIIKVLKKYAIGKVLKREKTSSSRTAPVCRVFNACGGCQLQHVSYEAQLRYKQEWMKTLFSRVNPEIEVRPVLAMKHPYWYRNKAQFPVQVKDGKVKMGFYRPHSNEIVECSQCAIQSKLINEVYGWLKEHLQPDQAENLRHIFLRTDPADEHIQVVFIGREEKEVLSIIEPLKKAFPQIVSIVFNENRRNDNVILSDAYSVLYGSESMEQSVLNLKTDLHFKSFFQVNPEMTDILYEQALQAADLHGNEEVIDFYSGTGTITMAAAGKAGHVSGVEIVKEAVENAVQNAQKNGIRNVDFFCQDASAFAAEFAASGRKADAVLVDPPRKGLTLQGIQDICLIQPERIVYVSCSPDTLARDLEIFQQKGYICRYIQPVDMFAQTCALENVALLERKK